MPGPGNYEFNESIHAQGKYFPSKYKSSGSKVWNPPSSQRFYKSCIAPPTQRLTCLAPGPTSLSMISAILASMCFRPTKAQVAGASTNSSARALFISPLKSQRVILNRYSSWPGVLSAALRVRTIRPGQPQQDPALMTSLIVPVFIRISLSESIAWGKVVRYWGRWCWGW